MPDPFGPGGYLAQVGRQVEETAGENPRAAQSKPQTAKSNPQTVESRAGSSLAEDLPEDLCAAVAKLGRRSEEEPLRDVLVRLCDWRTLTARQIAALLDRRSTRHLREQHLTPLVEEGRLERVRPAPNSRLQAYRTPKT